MGGYLGPDPAVANVLDQLAIAVASLTGRGMNPADPQAAGIRTIALALAADLTRPYYFHELPELVATVTLLQQRAQGRAPIGEAILLALA